MTADAGTIPRPKGVVVVTMAWAAGIVVFPALGARSVLAGGELGAGILPMTALSIVMTLLFLTGSSWALPIQVLILLPTLILFPFTLPAIVLLGYMTRPETVSYFKRRPEGPRWDLAPNWRKGEWPWLGTLGLLFALSVVVFIAVGRALPNL